MKRLLLLAAAGLAIDVSYAAYVLDIAAGTWTVYPLSRRGSFTRDVEFSPDGTAYTSISNFPSWHVETMQPTLIRVQP